MIYKFFSYSEFIKLDIALIFEKYITGEKVPPPGFIIGPETRPTRLVIALQVCSAFMLMLAHEN